DFEVANFEQDTFVNIDSEEEAREWFMEYQSWSKTTMPQTRGFEIKGSQVIFHEQRHCIHSNDVKKKQGNREMKHPQSSQAQNIFCSATIHMWLERYNLALSHPLK
ncbi:16921_t:CDS:1, partial [Dentiscutata heterogama]